MGPVEFKDHKHRYGHHPNKYIEIFNKIDVGRVVRLNDDSTYNK